MSDDRLLNIGAFAVLSGLSVPALRNYDHGGVLRPAVVDEFSGYRRYRLSQVPVGRTIKALRAIDVGLDDIVAILQADDDDEVRAILGRHRSRLAERQAAVAAQVAATSEYIDKGIPMSITPACRVVEVNIGADDPEAAAAFYEAAFGVEVVRDDHEEGFTHLMVIFGSWPSDEFFLLNIHDGDRRPERTGRADFGFLVDDVDAVHKRALAAGATESHPPTDISGMPRVSTILDPGGNLINLYQNVPAAPERLAEHLG